LNAAGGFLSVNAGWLLAGGGCRVANFRCANVRSGFPAAGFSGANAICPGGQNILLFAD
jgi:hypothetical protein